MDSGSIIVGSNPTETTIYYGGNMIYTKKYAKYNNYFVKRIKSYIEYCMANPSEERNEFLKEINDSSIDLEGTLYKLLVDDSELVNLNNGEFELLPMGLINTNIPKNIIIDDPKEVHYTWNTMNHILLDSPQYEIFYYPNDDTILRDDELHSLFSRISESYIKHYKDNLGEEWSQKTFYEMIKSLKYLSLKFARDVNTNEVFVIGFFGTFVRLGASGESLTNAELYVMDEFRGLGIAKKMVGLTFAKAQMDGIEDFDSITYRTPNMNALGFWNKIGANVSGLYHIEGSIPLMLESINNKKVYR